MPVPSKPIAPELLAEAQRLYEDTKVPVPDIAAMLGVATSTLYHQIPKLGWRRRLVRRLWPSVAYVPPTLSARSAPPLSPASLAPPDARIGEPPGPPAPDEAGPPFTAAPVPVAPVPDACGPDIVTAADAATLAVRIQRVVERELAALERIVASLGPGSRHNGEAERAARVLASLARTSREMKLIDSLKPTPEPSDDDAVPRDLDELRRALAEKLERLVAGNDSDVHREPDA